MTGKRKILHTMTWLAPGGGVDQNVFLTVQGTLDEYEVHVAVGREIHHNPFEGLPVKLWVCQDLVRPISPLKDLKALWYFFRLMRREGYDIVHTHEAKASLITRVAAWLARCPFIIYGVHGVTFNDPGSRLRRSVLICVERLTSPAADFIIGVSRDVIDIYHRCGIARKLPFEVVYSGIDVAAFRGKAASTDRAALRKSLGFSPEDVVLVNVGRFSPAKGQRHVIDVLAKLKPTHPNLKLLLIGEGELKDACRAQAAAAGLTADAVFYGFSDDVASLLPAADLFVFTSFREGLPRVVVEAYLSGLPAVSYQVEGIREIIADGETGYVVPSGDLSELASKVAILVGDAAKRREFSAIGLKRASALWDHKIMVNKLKQIYSEGDAKTAQVGRFFDGYAGDFDSLYGHTQRRGPVGRLIDRTLRKTMRLRFEETLRRTASPEIKSVLDVGCGPGRYCDALLKQGKSVVGLDLAPGMLELAKKLTGSSKDISFVHADYLAHKFDRKFDAACLMGFFDYIEKPIDVLRKLKTDVNKEIYASFPQAGGLLGWQRQLRYKWRGCPLYLYTREDVDALMAEAGLHGRYEVLDFGRDYFVAIKL